MTAIKTTQAATDRESRRERQLNRMRTGAALIAVALLGLLVWNAWASQDSAEEAHAQTHGLATQVQAACAAGGAAERELDAIGACDDADQAARGVAVANSAPIVEPATDGQVRAAVADYLTAHPPADGHTPTQAEVDAAVVRYCEANGCKGEDGKDGKDGTSGADGANGADATDDQVAAQVAAYCAADPSPCVGTPGPAGPSGPPGPPGPALDEYYVSRPGTLGATVTYHCVRRGAEEPVRYDCEEVPE